MGNRADIINSDAEARVERRLINVDGIYPREVVQRDLLHASLVRDHRVPMFHRLTNEPPKWVTRLVSHFPLRKQNYTRHSAIRAFLHQRHLLQPNSKAGFDTGGFQQLLDQLTACRSSGADWRL